MNRGDRTFSLPPPVCRSVYLTMYQNPVLSMSGVGLLAYREKGAVLDARDMS